MRIYKVRGKEFLGYFIFPLFKNFIVFQFLVLLCWGSSQASHMLSLWSAMSHTAAFSRVIFFLLELCTFQVILVFFLS